VAERKCRVDGDGLAKVNLADGERGGVAAGDGGRDGPRRRVDGQGEGLTGVARAVAGRDGDRGRAAGQRRRQPQAVSLSLMNRMSVKADCFGDATVPLADV
jgi:hypothetical protein